MRKIGKTEVVNMGKIGKTEVGTEVGERHKYGHVCVRFFCTPFPTSTRYSTVTSTKNDL